MGEINLDAGETTKIIAESVDAVEEYVESLAGDVFLSEKPTVPTGSSDPVPEGDRTEITARVGTPVYAQADPDGSGVKLRTGNATNGFNVARTQRRITERPGDAAARNGEIKVAKTDLTVGPNNVDNIPAVNPSGRFIVERLTVVPKDGSTTPYFYNLEIPAGGDAITAGNQDQPSQGFDPGISSDESFVVEVSNFNNNVSVVFLVSVFYREEV